MLCPSMNQHTFLAKTHRHSPQQLTVGRESQPNTFPGIRMFVRDLSCTNSTKTAGTCVTNSEPKWCLGYWATGVPLIRKEFAEI